MRKYGPHSTSNSTAHSCRLEILCIMQDMLKLRLEKSWEQALLLSIQKRLITIPLQSNRLKRLIKSHRPKFRGSRMLNSMNRLWNKMRNMIVFFEVSNSQPFLQFLYCDLYILYVDIYPKSQLKCQELIGKHKQIFADPMSLVVDSESVLHHQNFIFSQYNHKSASVAYGTPTTTVKIENIRYQFKTNKDIGKVGLLMVGFGGNNGSTILGGIIANREKLEWNTKKGVQKANMYGSMTQCSSMKVADSEDGEIYLRINQVIPLVKPEDLVVGGWDINSENLASAMKRAQVFDYELQTKLEPFMSQYSPMKSIYYKDFIASNQEDRANHLIEGTDKSMHLATIRRDISKFREENNLNKVIILWTANTERFSQEIQGVNDTYENLLHSIEKNHQEVAPSAIFAVAAIQEGCVFINGSPQNFVKGLREAEIKKGILIGNDFKTGQTKFKTSFIDFLTSAGIKPKSCVSYNHLGNNDGKNLASERQFKSKQASKSECIKDLLDNSLLYDPRDPKDQPDHTVVIKYVPNTGDSKKAIDEYTSEIFMGGQHVFVSYNVCEDSLLAAGVIIDLIVLSELMTRISFKKNQETEWNKIEGICSFLGYLTKAPQSKGPIINSLPRQRACIENLIRVLTGLPLEDNLLLGYRL